MLLLSAHSLLFNTTNLPDEPLNVLYNPFREPTPEYFGLGRAALPTHGGDSRGTRRTLPAGLSQSPLGGAARSTQSGVELGPDADRRVSPRRQSAAGARRIIAA